MAMREPYIIAADPRDRLCVQRGYATIDASANPPRILRYDIQALERAWMEWPDLRLSEFGRHWGIAYKVLLKPNYPFQVSRKRQVLAARSMTYRQSVLARAVIPEIQSLKEEEQAIADMLKQIREVGQAGLGYAHAKGIRDTDMGRVPNVALTPIEMKTCQEIAFRSAQILARWAYIRSIASGKLGDREAAGAFPEIEGEVAD